MSKYTWVITQDADRFETSNLALKKGPSGAKNRAPLGVVVQEGEKFRMLNDLDERPITGYIVGEFTGLEPLDEYGRQFGCTAIEFKRDGEWVRLPQAPGRTDEG